MIIFERVFKDGWSNIVWLCFGGNGCGVCGIGIGIILIGLWGGCIGNILFVFVGCECCGMGIGMKIGWICLICCWGFGRGFNGGIDIIVIGKLWIFGVFKIFGVLGIGVWCIVWFWKLDMWDFDVMNGLGCILFEIKLGWKFWMVMVFCFLWGKGKIGIFCFFDGWIIGLKGRWIGIFFMGCCWCWWCMVLCVFLFGDMLIFNFLFVREIIG